MNGDRRTRAAAAALVVVAIGLAGCARAGREKPGAPRAEASAGEPASPGLRVGDPFPSYSARALDGPAFSVADHRGEVILLNLWATWCVPCRAEVPVLEGLHQKHKGDRFQVVGVSMDAADQESVVRQLIREEKVTYPIALDPDANLQTLLEAMAIPASALIDRQGRLAWIHIGAIRENDPRLEKALKMALAGPSVR
ncbi:MAG TPA: TlpA disulfide reductase family protein [Thermoanaerobaculia bacterium]|nr:TlpA disulfide reductase family protein [Thermoanaerobaculia bacterium]